MTQALPALFSDYRVHPVDDYPRGCFAALRAAPPTGCATRHRGPDARVCTTPPTSSTCCSLDSWASSWSRERPVVPVNHVYMRTTQESVRCTSIYRRVDDDWLDPLQFRPDSMHGVPGW